MYLHAIKIEQNKCAMKYLSYQSYPKLCNIITFPESNLCEIQEKIKCHFQERNEIYYAYRQEKLVRC